MPDLLGATNPVPGYDRSVTNRSDVVSPNNNHPQIQNAPNLDRVSHADGRTEHQGSDLQGRGNIRYDSNYQTFLQRLKETPGMAETMTRIFSGRKLTFLYMRGSHWPEATPRPSMVRCQPIAELPTK